MKFLSPTFKRPGALRSPKQTGDLAEAQALLHLQKRGFHLLARNYRTPGRGGGEIDLIMRGQDGTLVFVEVRTRSITKYGGAAASISTSKRQRIVGAARHYLLHLAVLPPCRFDVVVIEPTGVEWIEGAFDTSCLLSG